MYSLAADCGQPTRASDPLWLRPGDLTPGIQATEYASRREALGQAMPGGSCAVLVSAPTLFYPGTVIPVPSLYRPNTDFFYLTGVTQPDCVAVLHKDAAQQLRYTLLTPAPDASDRTWHGPRIHADAARSVFGADESAHTSALHSLLADMLASSPGGLFCDLPPPHAHSTPLHDVLRSAVARTAGGQGPRRDDVSISSLKALVAPQRWLKSPAELNLMRASARATVAAQSEAAGVAVDGAREGAAAATFEAHVRIAGAQRLSFPSVAAAGSRACAVHYGRHDGAIGPSDLFLMDAGCELHGYVSDVTRTWPVSGGGFTQAQRLLYDALRAVHAQALAAVKPGVTLAQLHTQSVVAMSERIADLGMLPGAGPASSIARGPYFKLYPHALSHYLGLDTHDTPSVALTRPLEPGVVVTVEPGLYCWPDTPGLAPQFQGIAIRIEDMVAVTADGCEVLSSHDVAPVDGDDVHRWAANARARAAARKHA